MRPPNLFYTRQNTHVKIGHTKIMSSPPVWLLLLDIPNNYEVVRQE